MISYRYLNSYKDRKNIELFSLKSKIYQLFLTYYDSPIMYKLHNTNGYSMYICRLSSSLTTHKYLFLTTSKDDTPEMTKVPMGNLLWISLQIKLLKKKYNIPVHTYSIKKIFPFTNKITMIDKTKEYYKYKILELHLPIYVYLLIQSKSDYYVEEGILISALETNNTIITLAE